MLYTKVIRYINLRSAFFNEIIYSDNLFLSPLAQNLFKLNSMHAYLDINSLIITKRTKINI